MDIMDMEEDMENEQINIVNNKAALDIAMILDDMWRGLKKFYWIFLFLISMAATVFFVKAKIQYVPTYQAYASYVVNTQNAYGYSETYYNKTTAAQLGKTFPYILTSGVLKQVVAEELEMDSVPAEISAEAMEELLNVTPGSATVMGLLFDPEHKVQLLIDEEILNDEYLGCHPCINTSSLKIKTEDIFEKYLPAIGVEPTVLDIVTE